MKKDPQPSIKIATNGLYAFASSTRSTKNISKVYQLGIKKNGPTMMLKKCHSKQHAVV